MNKDKGRRLLDGLLAVLLGALAFALYARTLAPTVLAGDGGEFQFVPYLMGVAHPTGYPLYILLGWVWSHLLPLGDVAYRMNLFSALGAALAVGLLYPTSLSLLRQVFPSLSPVCRRLLGALASVTFAVTPTLWSQAIIAEVYGLNSFLVVLLFYLALAWGERRSRALLLLAAFCFGLGLAHHSTTLLLAPALLAYVWLMDRSVFLDWRRVLVPGLLLAILPLALYLTIPWRAPHTGYLRLPLAEGRELVLYENTLSNLLEFVRGGPFAASVDLSVDLGERLSMAWGFLLREVTWVGVILAVLGVIRLALSRRWALLALTGLAYVVTVAFNLVYTIGDIFVLFIPSYLVVVLWMVVGVGALVSLASRWRVAGVVVALLFFVLPVWLLLDSYGDVDQSRNNRARSRWQMILAEPLPENAILVSNDRNNIMPMWYFQYVDGLRPDLLGLFPQITPDYPELGQVLDLALSTGRPVYLIKEMPGVEIKAQVAPEGELWQVSGPASDGEPAYPVGLDLADTMSLVGYDRAPHSLHPGETLEMSLIWEVLGPVEAEYHTFVHLVDAAGRTVAQSDRQPGGVYYPTTLWQPGERLRDDHLLDVPAGAAPGVYRLVAGMYALAGDGTLIPLGETLPIGQVAVKAEVQTEPGDIATPVSASFGEQIELLGYDVAQEGGALTVTLHWRAQQIPQADYTVFVHLLDTGDEAISQHDGQPQDGAYPTSIWDAGEVVVDEHGLTLPPDLPPGDYGLRVGLYRLETGERLPVIGRGDSVDLGPLQLGKSD